MDINESIPVAITHVKENRKTLKKGGKGEKLEPQRIFG